MNVWMYSAIAVVLWPIFIFVGLNLRKDQGAEVDYIESIGIILGTLLASVFWVGSLILLFLFLAFKGMVKLNDFYHQSWATGDGDFKWIQVKYDNRTNATVNVRCRYCKGPLKRNAAMRTWNPCEDEECQTLFSMDEEAVEQYKSLKASQKAVEDYESNKKKWNSTLNAPVNIKYPNISGSTTSVGGWGTSTTTTANLDHNHTASYHSTASAVDIETVVEDEVRKAIVAANDEYIAGLVAKTKDENNKIA